MLTSHLPLPLNVGLFLFSKGDEIMDFTAEQAEQILAFNLERFRIGREFVEGLIEEFQGSVFAMDATFVATKIDSLCGTTADIDARTRDVGREVLAQIIVAAKDDPQALRDAMDAATPSDGRVSIPADWSVSNEVFGPSAVAYHVPVGEERERYDALTGAGEGEITAVLDTGIDSDHPDFEGKILGIFSEVPGESGEDINGHGTHVAGTCCGPKEISLSHRAKMISIKVLGGREGSGLSQWIEAGLRRARLWRGPKGERVTSINMSIGGGGFHAGTQRELQLCEAAGILVFAAAGNDGWRRGTDKVNEPARSEYTQAVGAIDANENTATFTSGGELVDEASPGVNVVSSRMGGGRVGMNGTSMATPVSDSKGNSTQSFLVRNGYARIDGVLEYRTFVAEHARDIGDVGEDDASGSGVLDVYETMIANSTDDVTILASGLKSAVQIAAAMFACVLFAIGSTGHAQEPVELTTVVRVVETTTELHGQTVIGNPIERLISETVTTSASPAFEIPNAETVWLLGSTLEIEKTDSIGGGVFTADPGRYAVFLESPELRVIEIASPEPEFDLSTIAPRAKELADTLNDMSTRLALADAYESALVEIENTDSEQYHGFVQLKIKSAARGVFAARSFENQNSDWVNGFQRPMQKELENLGASEGEAYPLAIAETIAGLREGFAKRTQTSNCVDGTCETVTYWVKD